MFNSSKNNKSSKNPTMISAHSVVCGDIVSSWCVDISGKVVGNIRCDYLILREGGAIQGDVIANTAVLDGNVVGTVHIKNVQLKKNANIEGSLIYNDMVAEQGAKISGQMTPEKTQIVLEGSAEEKYIMSDNINGN